MTKILIDKETVKLALSLAESIGQNASSYWTEADIPTIKKLAETLRQALEQSTEQEQGCDYCTNALYAGTKCKNCGRVTEQEPVAYRYTDINEPDFGFWFEEEPSDVSYLKCEPLYTFPPQRQSVDNESDNG